MLRLLLLGILVSGFGFGLQHGWIEIHWDRVQSDLGLPLRFGDGKDPLPSYSRSRQER
ncbi:MAG: 4-hydroxythreonine-4-phosphate dehydrogenase [Cyanobacteriota bacterium]|nr:4-hydroxythreonine-4-phosphate dehydrogenase [Cyanobacteriota bacterium]